MEWAVPVDLEQVNSQIVVLLIRNLASLELSAQQPTQQ